MDDGRGRTRCGWGAAEEGVSPKGRRSTAGGRVIARGVRATGANLITKDTQSRQHVFLSLVGDVRVGNHQLRATGLALRHAEDMLVGLQLEFQSLVAFLEHLVLLAESLDLRM